MGFDNNVDCLALVYINLSFPCLDFEQFSIYCLLNQFSQPAKLTGMKKPLRAGLSSAAKKRPTFKKHKKEKRSEHNPVQSRYERDPMSSPDPPSIASSDEHEDTPPLAGCYGIHALVLPRTPQHTCYHSPTRALTPLTPSSPHIQGQYHSEAIALLSPSPFSKAEQQQHGRYDNPYIMFSPNSGEHNQSDTQHAPHDQSDNKLPSSHPPANVVLAPGPDEHSSSSLPKPSIPIYSAAPDRTKLVKDFITHDLQRDGSKVFVPPIDAAHVAVRHVNRTGRAPLTEEQDPTLFAMDKFVCDSHTNFAYDYVRIHSTYIWLALIQSIFLAFY